MRYCYKCGCGNRWEEAKSFSDDILRSRCSCGRMGRRDYRAEHKHERSGEHGWPMVSEAAGINPSDIPATVERLAKQGVKCSFDGLGRPIMESMGHRRKVLKAMGLTDKNSYI